MPDSAPRPPGIGVSLKRLILTTVAILQNRVELLLVELHEERLRFFELLLLAGLVVLLATMTVAVLTVAIVVLCIRAGRFDLLMVIIAVYLLGTIIAFWRLRQRLAAWAPFSATLAELKKDKACLEEKN